MAVSESVKNRTDRRTTEHLRPEFVASAPRPTNTSSSRARTPASNKKNNARAKKQPKRISTTARKKTVTRREKASDRSLGGIPAGSLLRRKVLAAVLLHRATEQTGSKVKGRGTGKEARPSSRTTHPAIAKYVLETVGSEAGPKASAAARKELVEKGVLLSSKKGVLLTAAAEGAINDLGHDEDVDDLAAECLAHFYEDGSAISEAEAAPPARRTPSRQRTTELQDSSESEGDEPEEEEGVAEYLPVPKAATGRQRKAVVNLPRPAAAKPTTGGTDATGKLKKADLISRVKSLEQALSAAQQRADGSIVAEEDEDDAEELRRKLLDISVANQQWRKKALELRNRLGQHVDPATIDFDEREAYGLHAPDPEEQEEEEEDDGGDAILGGTDQQMFDDFVNPDAAASGPPSRLGFDDQDFPELDLDDRASAPDPNVTPSSSVKSKAKQQGESPSGPASSSSAWNGGAVGSSTTTGYAVSSPLTSPLQKAPSATGGAHPLVGGDVRGDDLSPAGIASERARADLYKEELELVQRAHHDKVDELTSVIHEAKVRLTASERRLVAYQAAAAASARASDAARPCEHEERLREHHAALADVIKRYEALEGELEAKTATLKQQGLELDSSAAEYEGLLGRKGRLQQELHSSSRRITELESQLEASVKQLEAHQTDTTATLEATAEHNKELEQELSAARIGAAKLKTALSHFEAELEKSSKELDAATSGCRDLQQKLEKSLREKDRETEALDNSMEQRRVLELELARLKEDLATVTTRSDEALAHYRTRAGADQETITTLTEELSDLLLKVENLEALEPTAERAEQYRLDITALKRELKDSETRYEQVQDARHAEESVLRARDAQIFELLQTNERLDLDLLDSEAQAERAKCRVNELERLRAQLVTELADSRTTLDNLLEQLHSALQDPDAVPFASLEQDAAAVVSAVHTMRKEWRGVRATSADQLALLNFVRSFARDIHGILPATNPILNDANVEAVLAAVLQGVCGARDTVIELQLELDEAHTRLARTTDVHGGLVAALSAGVGLGPASAPVAPNADNLVVALEDQANSLAAAVTSEIESLKGEISQVRTLLEAEQQAASASRAQTDEQKHELASLQVELSEARSVRDTLEARLASIRELVRATD